MKRFDQLESGDTPNIHFMLTTDEQKLRFVLLSSFSDSSGPVNLSKVELNLEDIDINVSETIKKLKEKGLVVMQDQSVTGLYPYSAIQTKHRVQLDPDKSVFAMCAIDSLGVAYEMNQDVKVSSSCAFCNEVIEVDIVGGEVARVSPHSSRAIHVSLSEYKNWAASC